MYLPMSERPRYVVHRLDKETSGAVLFAKNPLSCSILNRLLENKDIQREYWALVDGKFIEKAEYIGTNRSRSP